MVNKIDYIQEQFNEQLIKDFAKEWKGYKWAVFKNGTGYTLAMNNCILHIHISIKNSFEIETI
mgnify:CR=1 FL=1